MTQTAARWTPVLLHLNNHTGSRDTPYALGGRVGSPGIPMLTHVATPAGQLAGPDEPEATVTGVACGHCSYDGETVRHATVAHVRACAESIAWVTAEAEAEWPLARAGWL